MFFYPFDMARKYMKLRGNYTTEYEQFFIFRDGSPVKPSNVRSVLKLTLKSLNLDHTIYSCHSFRIGWSGDLHKRGVPIDKIKMMGRWKTNVVFKYIRS